MKDALLIIEKENGKKSIARKITTVSKRYGYEYQALAYHMRVNKVFEDQRLTIEKISLLD